MVCTMNEVIHLSLFASTINESYAPLVCHEVSVVHDVGVGTRAGTRPGPQKLVVSAIVAGAAATELAPEARDHRKFVK